MIVSSVRSCHKTCVILLLTHGYGTLQNLVCLEGGSVARAHLFVTAQSPGPGGGPGMSVGLGMGSPSGLAQGGPGGGPALPHGSQSGGHADQRLRAALLPTTGTDRLCRGRE